MTRHALVVDDNAMLVRTLTDILRLDGWQVTTASSGGEAVDEVAARDFDIVLMDIKMPGVNGVEAFHAMRAVRPGVRVVLMSAYAAPDLVADAERAGVVRVMAKPVDPASLLAMLAAPAHARRPVLIIDSDAAFLRSLSDLLTQEGHVTVVANDLAHATSVLAEARPVAVLLHLHLGDVSAHEAVSTVHRARPDAALIVYTGRPGAAHEVTTGLPPEWIHAFLEKPFGPARVSAVLEGLRDSA